MRIVSWNMNAKGLTERHLDGWTFLLDELQPDIALLQETVPPADPVPGYDQVFTEAWDGHSWGSAVLSRVGGLELVWEHRDRGAVVLADTSLDGIGVISIASLHARVRDYRVIPPLRETLDELKPQLRTRFILGGDLNTARSAADAWPGNGHREFWEEIEGTWGLHEHLPAGGRELQSYWREWQRNQPPTIGNSLQDDHVFLDAETFKYPAKCRLWDTKRVRELSDHGPVVLDVSVPGFDSDRSADIGESADER
jgi:exonuclease III